MSYTILTHPIKLWEGISIVILKYVSILLLQYHPSCAGGTCSPPAMPVKSKMATRVFQNGRRGLEGCLPLSFRALSSTFAKQIFLSEHSFDYEKSRRQRKKEKKKEKEKNGENSGPLPHIA